MDSFKAALIDGGLLSGYHQFKSSSNNRRAAIMEKLQEESFSLPTPTLTPPAELSCRAAPALGLSGRSRDFLRIRTAEHRARCITPAIQEARRPT